ncbi:GIY-YIG nuclease family protein [Phormidium sp. LEGE 05292]|uniref:GIY-YIG nuclease family protein n=1 Tax=[Phormidium] sp. LEGE 05292 TaxID=767427 RepID=UPI00187E9946|nr:GIY-YIG nuclease family protein [Phormidium sp. LEGE 05292]MBE9224042.1 GIY-YIG nuclease family protein [Phormidium sp. LEGE 05292]
MEHQQLNLFPDFYDKTSKPEQLVMDSEALQKWKNQIFRYQQKQRESQAPQQGTLFDLAPNHCDSDAIDPFILKLQPSQFYRMPEQGDSICVYLVIDNALPILLYVGETKRTPKQRWISHDCQEYIINYIEMHRRYELPVEVATAFWWDTPPDRKARQKLERELILKWRSPFNKENWELWCQPFGKFS